MKTNLDLVYDTDKFPYFDDQSAEGGESILTELFTLIWEDEKGKYPIGYVRQKVVDELDKIPLDIKGEMDIDQAARTIQLFKGVRTEPERSQIAKAIGDYWRGRKAFDILKAWRNELWPVYDRKGGLLFSMERAAIGLLGTVRYGVHMVAYVKDEQAPYGIKIWVPKRAADKSTFPGMLDNTVAGGLMTGEDPSECIIREADEEASLPESLVRENIHPVGTVTYIDITEKMGAGEDGLIYPECEWIYDLLLPTNVVPFPKDGEVEEFKLCTTDEIQRDLADGRFKPNCALVTINFFIRHGILTKDNEPELEAILKRMHRKIPFPGPHQSQWPGNRATGNMKMFQDT